MCPFGAEVHLKGWMTRGTAELKPRLRPLLHNTCNDCNDIRFNDQANYSVANSASFALEIFYSTYLPPPSGALPLHIWAPVSPQFLMNKDNNPQELVPHQLLLNLLDFQSLLDYFILILLINLCIRRIKI